MEIRFRFIPETVKLWYERHTNPLYKRYAKTTPQERNVELWRLYDSLPEGVGVYNSGEFFMRGMLAHLLDLSAREVSENERIYENISRRSQSEYKQALETNLLPALIYYARCSPFLKAFIVHVLIPEAYGIGVDRTSVNIDPLYKLLDPDNPESEGIFGLITAKRLEGELFRAEAMHCLLAKQLRTALSSVDTEQEARRIGRELEEFEQTHAILDLESVEVAKWRQAYINHYRDEP